MSGERTLDPRTSCTIVSLPPILEDPSNNDIQLSEGALLCHGQELLKEQPPSCHNLPALISEGGLATEVEYLETRQ